MSQIATVEPSAAPAATQRVKRPRISPKILKAIRLLVSGECKTQKAAAARVGVSDTYLSTQLNKPAIGVFVAQEARKTISQGVMRASSRLIDLIDAGSEHVSLDATKHVLAIEGIKPTGDAQVAVNVNLSAGFVINFADPRDPRAPQPTIKQID
jgi:predicted DNA-binding protein (UPF0251 family)